MNRNIRIAKAIALGATVVAAGVSYAAVSVEEAKQLGGSVLTEWGAEKAGNKEGTIPAWTGERAKTPASYDPKESGQTPDPWDDKPMFSITAQNMDKYSEKLTEGQKEMFRKYPSYRMDVYQTRRTVFYPKWVIDNTLKNATSAKAANGGIRLEGAYGGIPFPIPKTGNEVVWNHLLAYTPVALTGLTQALIVDANGHAVLQGLEDVHYQFPFWDPNIPGIRAPDSLYWMVRFDALAPTRKVGEKYIILNPLDPINPGQRAWQYVPGQRRVKLLPDLAYDTPNPVSGGAVTMDESQGFLGAQDRFDFKLVGKKERFIMVNNQKIQDYKVCPNEKALTKNFPNPDCIRFELHRTWEVDLTLKPGFRNVMPKRKLWLDEDWSGASIADNYDASGKLYRLDYSPISLAYQYEQPYQMAHSSWTFDFQTGMYANSSWMGFKEGNRAGGYTVAKPAPLTVFSPETLAGEGVR